jgi:hypothetical protein
MESKETIDQGSSRWSNKVLAILFFGSLFGSNVLNTYINTQYHHELKIENLEIEHNKDIIKEKKANARRLGHSIEKQDYKIEIKDLKRDKIILEKELKNCNK